jgi:hypothetical protein
MKLARSVPSIARMFKFQRAGTRRPERIDQVQQHRRVADTGELDDAWLWAAGRHLSRSGRGQQIGIGAAQHQHGHEWRPISATDRAVRRYCETARHRIVGEVLSGRPRCATLVRVRMVPLRVRQRAKRATLARI